MGIIHTCTFTIYGYGMYICKYMDMSMVGIHIQYVQYVVLIILYSFPV